MVERKVVDATAAETVVRRQMEAQYGDRLKSVSFRKSWYSAAGGQEYWDVEGTITRKKGLLGREIRNFRYQIDPYSGNIMGYEEVSPK